MRRWNRLAAACLSVLLLIAAAGCAGRNARPRVTLVLKTKASVAEFWEMLLSGVNCAAEEFDVDLQIISSSAESAVDEQIALIRKVAEEKPDVMILSAADYDRCAEATQQAIQAGVKVVSLDTDVNTPDRSCFVGSDNYQIGWEMGAQMCTLLPDGGKVAILQHMRTTTSGTERTRGAIDALCSSPAIEVIGEYCCENAKETAQTITMDLLEQHPDIAGFVCTNEVCNVGVADALVSSGLAGSVFLVGCDNSQRQIQYLEQDVIHAIVVQRPFNMGYLAVQQAVDLLHGKKIDSVLTVPCVTITKENMYTTENQKLLFPLTEA